MSPEASSTSLDPPPNSDGALESLVPGRNLSSTDMDNPEHATFFIPPTVSTLRAVSGTKKTPSPQVSIPSSTPSSAHRVPHPVPILTRLHLIIGDAATPHGAHSAYTSTEPAPLVSEMSLI